MSNNPILKWTSYPLFDFPIKSIILNVFLLIFSYFYWKITVIVWEMPLFFYLGITALLGSLITYYIPTRYEFYADKIVIYYAFIKIEKKYTDFVSFYQDKNGIMLSTFTFPSRLDPFRGQSVRFSKRRTEKEALIDLLKEKGLKRI